MRWTRALTLFLLLLCPAPAVLAQSGTGTVIGTVVDAQTARPVADAAVTVSGTQRGAVTGADGRFTVAGVPSGSHTVHVSKPGYTAADQTVAVAAGATANVSVRIAAAAVQLQSLVAVGYGTQSRRNVTGSVSTVDLTAAQSAPVASLDQVLQGTAPGVQVTTASSEPGGALSIRIRGTSSITGNAEPLYVIDGFPIENDIEGSSVGNGGRTRTTPTNPLATLNPSDIESVSVLKDASATAIYGARGANGVVIITTKQGRGTKPQFSLDYYTGTQSVAKRYDLLNAQEYMDYANQFAANASTPYVPFPDSTRARIVAAGLDTDWQDQVFRRAGLQNWQLSVRGATATGSPTRYALSGGYFDQEGIVAGSGIRRYSARVNLNQALGSRVELGGSFSASQARSKSVPTAGQQNANAGAVSAALQYVPILPVRRADGTYSYINTDLNAYNSLLDAPQTPNPVSLTNEVRDSLSDTRLLGNLFGQVSLLQDLKLRVSLGTDYASRWRNTYYPRTTLRGGQSNGEAIRAEAATASWLNENTLTYDHDFGDKQSLQVLGGYTRQSTTLDGSNMSNTQFVSDITGYFDIGAGTQEGGPSISSRRTQQTLESYLSRVNYSLLDRYLFTLTYRADGSSRFAASKKWGSFPSAAFAWRASEEPWLHLNHLDDLKFRASYGLVGNPSIRPYQSLSRLNDQGYSFGGSPYSGYYPVAVGNPDLTWETTRQADFGVDLAFMNRFTLTADYYRKRTNDLLLQISLPFETGFESALANRGSVENHGFEVGLDTRILRGDKGAFGWRANLNFARNTNKVTSLGGPDRIFADLITTDYNLPGTLIQVGKPIGVFYGFKSAGVIRDSAEAAAITYKNFNGQTFKPGDMRVLDIDGDGQITLNDRTDIGDPTPDFTVGLTNTFSFRGFELTGLLQGSYGSKILNVNRIRTESSPRVNVSRERFFDAWSPTNPNGSFPRVGENPNQVGTNNFTSNLLEDGSYLRLRTLTLTAPLPGPLARRARLTSSRVYVTGTNLFTISDYSGFDPDVSSQSVGNTNRGIDIGAYPLARTVTLGLSLTY
ncbi:MAG TPA: TonB-dependent receptor [Longimicrobiaceae bacterium]|jgi:TonB-linked SusC/RagA family outer membrane protein|nr:TonB-dependent receptor [Longimicrobiaceae bacterium]